MRTSFTNIYYNKSEISYFNLWEEERVVYVCFFYTRKSEYCPSSQGRNVQPQNLIFSDLIWGCAMSCTWKEIILPFFPNTYYYHYIIKGQSSLFKGNIILLFNSSWGRRGVLLILMVCRILPEGKWKKPFCWELTYLKIYSVL